MTPTQLELPVRHRQHTRIVQRQRHLAEARELDVQPTVDVWDALRAQFYAVAETAEPAVTDPEQIVISPELVLVCPELRAIALQLLPDRDPDGFLPKRAAVAPQPEVTPEPTPRVIPTTQEQPPGLLVAAAAYTFRQAFSVTVHGAAIVAAFAALVIFIEFVRP